MMRYDSCKPAMESVSWWCLHVSALITRSLPYFSYVLLASIFRVISI